MERIALTDKQAEAIGEIEMWNLDNSSVNLNTGNFSLPAKPSHTKAQGLENNPDYFSQPGKSLHGKLLTLFPDEPMAKILRENSPDVNGNLSDKAMIAIAKGVLTEFKKHGPIAEVLADLTGGVLSDVKNLAEMMAHLESVAGNGGSVDVGKIKNGMKAFGFLVAGGYALKGAKGIFKMLQIYFKQGGLKGVTEYLKNTGVVKFLDRSAEQWLKGMTTSVTNPTKGSSVYKEVNAKIGKGIDSQEATRILNNVTGKITGGKNVGLRGVVPDPKDPNTVYVSVYTKTLDGIKGTEYFKVDRANNLVTPLGAYGKIDPVSGNPLGKPYMDAIQKNPGSEIRFNGKQIIDGLTDKLSLLMK